MDLIIPGLLTYQTHNMKDRNDKLVFWGCFIALITTAFAFITRAFMVNDPGLWPKTFGLNAVQGQELFQAGIWPFAISIILFSLIIDKIGYRVAMVFSFVCYAAYAVFAFMAYGTVNAEGLDGQALKDAQAQAYKLLYIGSIILGLGNGTVEAYINPVVATMFKKDKTKWLNILHAGWPGGLVLGGILTILLGAKVADDWRVLIVIIAIPAIVFLVMLIKAKFPVNERVAAGATYREMLGEFGAIGAAIAAYLITKELGKVFEWSDLTVIAIVAVLVIAYGLYCKSPGRPMMIFLCIVMFPLATTELGTDGAITGIMEGPLKEAGQNPLWVLIYTSAIMTVLRFFSGPIVHKLTPLGLLATCALLAIAGLYFLSITTTLVAIFAAATLYGIGKTFFWPTTLGVVAEQFPKGGALTLNAIAGIGMLSVGIVGGPLIGAMQEKSVETAVQEEMAEGTYAKISKEDTYFLGKYNAIDGEKLKDLSQADQDKIGEVSTDAKQGSLAKITIFPALMLLCYLGLIFYFKSRGGYKPVELGGDGGGH